MENKKEKFNKVLAIIFITPIVIIVISSFFYPLVYWGWQMLNMPAWIVVVMVLILYIFGKLVEKFHR